MAGEAAAPVASGSATSGTSSLKVIQQHVQKQTDQIEEAAEAAGPIDPDSDNDEDEAPSEAAFLDFVQLDMSLESEPMSDLDRRLTHMTSQDVDKLNWKQQLALLQQALRESQQLGTETSNTAFLRQRGPFAKVKKMIDGMIAKLLDEAAAEASKKKWCDAEIAKTTSQKGVHDGWINKLTARLQECS